MRCPRQVEKANYIKSKDRRIDDLPAAPQGAGKNKE
jgi:hypothetical protein